jgi:hypothetical protein
MLRPGLVLANTVSRCADGALTARPAVPLHVSRGYRRAVSTAET